MAARRNGGTADVVSAACWVDRDADGDLDLGHPPRVGEVVSAMGYTPLMTACIVGHSSLVRLALANLADPNTEASNGKTALIFACQSGRTACVELLLAAGADAEHGAGDGRTPLMCACFRGYDGSARLLLASRAHPDRTNDELETAMTLACERGRVACIRALLEAGADPELPSVRGIHPLMLACLHRHCECARALVDAGADPDGADNNGVTSLMMASRRADNLACVRLLLEKGADVNRTDATGAVTALAAACLVPGNLPTIQLISSYGARRRLPALGHVGESMLSDVGDGSPAGLWLLRSREWCTPLHHVEILTADRAWALLRGGADVHSRTPVAGAPSPLDLALDLVRAGVVDGGADSAAGLVIAAAAPWTSRTHDLHHPDIRARAVALLLVGCALADEERFGSAGGALRELWVERIMPWAVPKSPDVAHGLLPPVRAVF